MATSRRLTLALVSAAAASLSGARRSAAAEDSVISVSRASKPTAAASEHFTGIAEVSAPFRAHAPARASGGLVSFTARARTNWHTHPLGQTLIVMSGSGLVQHWGGPAERIGPSDVAWIPPGTKHWHGAGPDGPLTHVAISEVQDGKTAEWLEAVSDADYAAALKQQ